MTGPEVLRRHLPLVRAGGLPGSGFLGGLSKTDRPHVLVGVALTSLLIVQALVGSLPGTVEHLGERLSDEPLAHVAGVRSVAGGSLAVRPALAASRPTKGPPVAEPPRASVDGVASPKGTSDAAVASGVMVAPWGTQTFSSASTNYNVTFTENGLPSGTSWSLKIDNLTNSTNSTELNFSLPAGTYSYHAGYVAGYRLVKPGNVTVLHGPVNVAVKFSVNKYAVAFVETGLPRGTVWNVTLTPSSGTATSSKSTSSTIHFGVPNGTYTYSIAPVPGYALSGHSSTGSVKVAGSSPSIDVSWASTSSGKSSLSFLDYAAIGASVLIVGLVLVVLWLRHRNRKLMEASPPPAPNQATAEPKTDSQVGSGESGSAAPAPTESAAGVPPGGPK